MLLRPLPTPRVLVSSTAAGHHADPDDHVHAAPERVRDLVAPDTATADGVSLAEVIALLAADTPIDQRTVAFTTTVGQLVSGNTAAVTATAGTDLRAVVLLRAPVDTARAIVTATAGASVRTRVITYARAQPGERVELVPLKSTLTAGAATSSP